MADNVATVRRWVDDVWNNGRFETVDGYMAAEYHNEIPGAETANGRQELADFIAGYRAAFEDLHVDVTDIAAAGADGVVWVCTVTGTHTGELMGIPATGREINVRAVIKSTFNTDGKWVYDFAMWDALGMLIQLGVVDLPAPAAV
jgi:steroid delta-isomerase-like uncharacterized protein